MLQTNKESLNTLVYKTNTLLRSQLQAMLKEYELTTEQWGTLRHLSEKDGINQKELSLIMFKEQAAITRSLDLLEKRGLIERRRSSFDRREFLVFITEEGQILFQRTKPSIEQYRQTLSTLLSKEEAATLHSLLSKLLDELFKLS